MHVTDNLEHMFIIGTQSKAVCKAQQEDNQWLFSRILRYKVSKPNWGTGTMNTHNKQEKQFLINSHVQFD